MRAKVKADYRYPTLRAFGGVDFNKREFTFVPSGAEQEATAHPFLELETEQPEPGGTLPAPSGMLEKPKRGRRSK